MNDLLTPNTVIIVVLLVAVAANAAFAFIVTRRHPPVGRFLDVDGVRLHYIERGGNNAPPLVMFHGNGTLIQDLTISGLVEVASKRFRVICFDRPGFGHSQRPRFVNWTPARQAQLFNQALAQLGVTAPLVLGHSWGTLVALTMAAHPTLGVRGLVLVSGYYFPTFRLDVLVLSGPAVPIFGDLLRYTISPLIGWIMLPGILRKLFSPRAIPQIFNDEFPKALTLRPGQLRAAAEEAAFMIPAAMALGAAYPTIVCPVAIIAGEDDVLIESEQASKLKQVLPLATVVRVPGFGHMLHHHAPDDVVRAVDTVHARALPNPIPGLVGYMSPI